MGILKSSRLGIYTSILKLLTKRIFEKLGAYEIGLIDKDGVVDKKRKAELKLTMDGRMDLSTRYTTFLRLVIRLKSLLAKSENSGKSFIARYGGKLWHLSKSMANYQIRIYLRFTKQQVLIF